MNPRDTKIDRKDNTALELKTQEQVGCRENGVDRGTKSKCIHLSLKSTDTSFNELSRYQVTILQLILKMIKRIGGVQSIVSPSCRCSYRWQKVMRYWREIVLYWQWYIHFYSRSFHLITVVVISWREILTLSVFELVERIIIMWVWYKNYHKLFPVLVLKWRWRHQQCLMNFFVKICINCPRKFSDTRAGTCQFTTSSNTRCSLNQLLPVALTVYFLHDFKPRDIDGIYPEIGKRIHIRTYEILYKIIQSLINLSCTFNLRQLIYWCLRTYHKDYNAGIHHL